ncbi:secretin N-terminal domain-containing protein [Paraglaciecola hydrolytica]|uniref:Uncharacterized protein n=1 Tax=Paraglaciecola hydrolytica TaxID=1799789 RepID=A0A135ZYW1_9ALTE|nr:secretin N-terminal domain-containing protein [Paraglaciecola hydrolytica]KXI28154.1 hypothetical protein AX660_17390 [Paraglaciecola hydrolytica]
MKQFNFEFRTIKLIGVGILVLLVCGCAASDYDAKKEGKEKKLVSTRSFLSKTPTENSSKTSRDNNEESPQTGTRNNFKTSSIESVGGLSKLSETANVAPKFDELKVSFVADELGLVEFVSQVYGDILQLNYVLAPELQVAKEKVSLSIAEPVSKIELYQISKNVLGQHQINLLRKEDIVYFQKISPQQKKNDISIGIGKAIEDIPDSINEITQIVPYVYSESRNITDVMSKLSSTKLTILSKQKLIIIEGEKSEIERAIRLVNMLDVPRAYGREIRLLEFQHISPKDAEDQIKVLLEEDGFVKGAAGDYSFVPMPRINALVAYAASEEIINRVLYWAAKLDVPLAGDEPRFYVFKPKFSKASALMTSLSALITGIKSDRKQPESTTDNASDRNSSSASGGRLSSSVGGGRLSMSFDETQNALIFQATPAEYKQVLSLLTQLDQLPGQVILDVAIVEVTLSDNVRSGIDWLYNSRGQTASNGLVVDLTSSSSLLSATGIKGNWEVALNLLDEQTDTRVLSKPYLVVQDGMSASISSGDSIPITTESVQDVGDSNTVANTVQYKNTGTQVSFTPVINSDGVISLEVSMSVSSSGGGSLTPTITNRALTTTVLAIDGQTIVLGGMIQETNLDEDNRVPKLGDIPLFGKLFQQKRDEYTRTELLMLITTKIVKTANDVDEFGRKMAELYSIPIEL